ncbi:MAG: NAD-binding protein [Deltaproteobacteria bacterium]|nr:NAD-binding protein [Deltaproteobacteria bacterium]
MWSRAKDHAREIYTVLKRERVFKILGFTFVIILYGALALYFADRYYDTQGARGLFDAIYWAVVTLTTVGYGDIVPTTKVAKFFALTIILSGPALLSLITASIASVFVEQKIKEGKGLEAIKDKGHIVICGWNENGTAVVEALKVQHRGGPPKIALVNELDRDEVQSIQYHYEGADIRFVRGDFVKEAVLARANIHRARSAIVMADVSGGHILEKADQRTIFATMAIKSMASKVRTCAELIHAENREHLIRAKVDEIIVRGESSGPLLATAAVSPGVTDSIRRLVNNQDENKLWRVRVTGRLAGRTYGEAARQLRNKYGALLLGVVREEEQIKLEDILSDDSTFIDDFIRRKFEESGKDYFGEKRGHTVILNPDDAFELTLNDGLVVISRERPEEVGIVEKLVGSG